MKLLYPVLCPILLLIATSYGSWKKFLRVSKVLKAVLAAHGEPGGLHQPTEEQMEQNYQS